MSAADNSKSLREVVSSGNWQAVVSKVNALLSQQDAAEQVVTLFSLFRLTTVRPDLNVLAAIAHTVIERTIPGMDEVLTAWKTAEEMPPELLQKIDEKCNGLTREALYNAWVSKTWQSQPQVWPTAVPVAPTTNTDRDSSNLSLQHALHSAAALLRSDGIGWDSSERKPLFQHFINIVKEPRPFQPDGVASYQGTFPKGAQALYQASIALGGMEQLYALRSAATKLSADSKVLPLEPRGVMNIAAWRMVAGLLLTSILTFDQATSQWSVDNHAAVPTWLLIELVLSSEGPLSFATRPERRLIEHMNATSVHTRKLYEKAAATALADLNAAERASFWKEPIHSVTEVRATTSAAPPGSTISRDLLARLRPAPDSTIRTCMSCGFEEKMIRDHTELNRLHNNIPNSKCPLYRLFRYYVVTLQPNLWHRVEKGDVGDLPEELVLVKKRSTVDHYEHIQLPPLPSQRQESGGKQTGKKRYGRSDGHSAPATARRREDPAT